MGTFRSKWSWGALGLWLLTFLAYAGYQGSQIKETVVPNAPPRVMVVLGSGLRDSQPTSVLMERLRTAAYWGSRFPSTPIIVSGGLGKNQAITEARAMADFLQNQPIQNPIILEDKSKNTFENIQFTNQIFNNLDLDLARDASIWIITSDFHAPRAGWIAQHAGWYQTHVVSAHTPISNRPLAWFREYFSWIKGWVSNEF